jgi:hypothetical protein
MGRVIISALCPTTELTCSTLASVSDGDIVVSELSLSGAAKLGVLHNEAQGGVNQVVSAPVRAAEHGQITVPHARALGAQSRSPWTSAFLNTAACLTPAQGHPNNLTERQSVLL